MTAELVVKDAESDVVVVFAGDWLLGQSLPGPEPVLERLQKTPKPVSLRYDANALGQWDTGLIKSLVLFHRSAESQGIAVDDVGLPQGARQLVALAFAVKEREGARRVSHDKTFLERVGDGTLSAVSSTRDLLTFTGELILSCGRFLRGKATYLRSDFFQYVQEAGADALPIVSLISFLIGMIFAFVGFMQLKVFGAGILTADLVAIAMVREMSAIMTGIIMAGRTGAAYAAQIGTMKVNEEVDHIVADELTS